MSRNLVWLSLSLVIWGVGEGAFFYFQPIYLQQLGADPLQIGLILGGVGFAMSIAHLPAGYLADRFGRRPLLIAAWTTGTLAAWTMALAPSLPLFVIGSALYGLTSFVSGPMNSYVTAARGSWSIGRTLTLISAVYATGTIVGPLIGGWIGDKYDLRICFFLAASLFIVSALVMLLTKPQPVEQSIHQHPTQALSRILHPRFIQFLTVTFIAILVMYLPQPLSQNFLTNERGIDLLQIGQLIAWRSIGIVVLNLVLGQVNARISFTISQLAMVVYAFLLWQGDGMPWYVAAYLLVGGFQTARSMAAAQVRVLVDADNMGLAYGMLETSTALAVIIASPVAGFIYRIDPLYIYAASVGSIIISILVVIFWTPVKPKDII